MWRQIAGTVLLLLGLMAGLWRYRRSRDATLLEGMARGALCVAPVVIGSVIAGSIGAWCAAPLCVAAGWIGKSPLGILNFTVLQWFGVRLQAEFGREAWLKGPRGRWWASDAPAEGPIAWSLLRWVWPLTGWWSGYRYIRRRP